ncbi:hypothetical protein G6F22_017018 [Rhizopus arrhizus]|nr:hypothetical protein G6F22_017018 [Rhizopus arrhizus]KAG1249611.1 hypothetical protein G6F65_019068 [Rhizopus arrhizus]
MTAQRPSPPSTLTAHTGQHLAALHAVGIATQAEAETTQLLEGVGLHTRGAGAQVRRQRRTGTAEAIAAFHAGTAEAPAIARRDTVGAGPQQQLAIQRTGELTAAELGQRIATPQVPAGIQLRLRLAITTPIATKTAATVAAGLAEGHAHQPVAAQGQILAGHPATAVSAVAGEAALPGLAQGALPGAAQARCGLHPIETFSDRAA